MLAPTLASCPEDICDEDILSNPDGWAEAAKDADADFADEREEWLEELNDLKWFIWNEIGSLLENENITLRSKTRLAQLVANIEDFSLVDTRKEDFQEEVEDWNEEEDIDQDLRTVIQGSLEQVKLYGSPINRSANPNEIDTDVAQNTIQALATHLAAFLYGNQRQQEQNENLIPDSTNLVRASLQIENSIQHSLIWNKVNHYLRAGLLVNGVDLLDLVEEGIENADSHLSLYLHLELLASLYPSFQENPSDLQPIWSLLLEKASAVQDRGVRKLYLRTLAAGAVVAPDQIQQKISSVSVDVLLKEELETRMNQTRSINL